MLMLAPSATGKQACSVVISGGGPGSFGSTLAGGVACVGVGDATRGSCVSSSVLGDWDGLKDVCNGTDTVYLLSALDLPPYPSDSELQTFTTGVSRVVDSCLECGVESLVFTSVSNQVSSDEEDHGEGQGRADRATNIAMADVAYVTRQEKAKSHAVAQAESIVLKASGRYSGGSRPTLRLHTCALRPAAIIYGTSEPHDGLRRALSRARWGLHRVALQPNDAEGASSHLVHVDNLVEAHLLAAAKLKMVGPGTATSPDQEEEGRRGIPAGEGTTSRAAGASPACSGQAYFVGDGQPCNPQAFLDSVFGGLGFNTSKLMRVPTSVALVAARIAELLCKVGLAPTPWLTRRDIQMLVQKGTLSSNARAQRDLGYMPSVDAATATKKTVESLKRAGWGKHRVHRPALGYWICNPGGIWLVTLAAFGGPCPPFLAPLAINAERVGVLLLHQLSTVRALCVAVYLVHVLEGVYAFRVARKAGHRDTAPSWFLQTFILGFPSISLVNRLESERAGGGEEEKREQ